MWEKLEQLLTLLANMPETMRHLDELIAKIAFYFQAAVVIGILGTLVYYFYNPIVQALRHKEMRDIDDRESRAAEVKSIVEVARAMNGDHLKEADLLAAVPVYNNLVRALREHQKKNK